MSPVARHGWRSSRFGHGIGLDGHEWPYIVHGNTRKLVPGVSFSDEPGIYIPGELGIRHEDTVVVTEKRLTGGRRSSSRTARPPSSRKGGRTSPPTKSGSPAWRRRSRPTTRFWPS